MFIGTIHIPINDTFVYLQIAAEPLGRLDMLSTSIENRQLWYAQGSLFFLLGSSESSTPVSAECASLIAAYKKTSTIFHTSVKVGMQQSHDINVNHVSGDSI